MCGKITGSGRGENQSVALEAELWSSREGVSSSLGNENSIKKNKSFGKLSNNAIIINYHNVCSTDDNQLVLYISDHWRNLVAKLCSKTL